MVTITKDYIQLGIVVLMFLVFIYWDIKKYGSPYRQLMFGFEPLQAV